jgi:TonB family protein
MSLDTKPQRPKRATTLLFALAPLITPTLFTPAMAQAPSTTELQTSNPADPVIEAYTPPKPKHIDIPQFPHDQLLQNNEGWVQLSFMVDPDGKPFDATVVRSVGNKKFEKLALDSIQHATFEPATLNGKPTEARFEMKYEFEDRRPGLASGARKDFIRAYKALGIAIESGDRPAADAALQKLEVNNLYEDAYTGIVQYMYARQWGTPSQQLDALNRAIAEEPRAHYLPNELFRGALLDSFRLQANLHMYSEAMTTWDRLQHTGLDKGTAMKLKEVIARLDAIRKDDSAYTVQGAIEDGRWHLHLFKRHFQVRVNDGQVSDVKLRCDKHHYMFAFDPSLQYTLNSHAGDCSIELLGAPGTRFDFIQF